MPEDSKTRKWRAKFAAKKIQFEAGAPPSMDAMLAFRWGIAGAAATVVAVILALTGIWWLKWIALVVWLIGLPFTMRGILRGKFEGDVINAGRSPARGKPLARTGMFLGLGAAGLTLLYLVFLLIMALQPAPSLPGKYGSAEKTFNEYIRAIRADDFAAYKDCLAGDVKNAASEAAFGNLKTGRARQNLDIQSIDYSDGGTNARDANRADMQIQCTNPASNITTAASMRMAREEDGWKVIWTDL
jgi:hypothetical protein